MKKRVLRLLSENLSYKIAAFFIAFLLWIIIIGRRDFIYTKTFDLNFKVSDGLTVAAVSSDRIRVRISGPRAILKKFIQDQSESVIQIEVANRRPGLYDFDLSPQLIQVPSGVKVLSLRPNSVRIEIANSP